MRLKHSGLSMQLIRKIEMWLVDNQLVNHNNVGKIIHVVRFSKEKDTKSSEDKEDPNIEPGDDSKEVGGTNDASNQLIPYVWFFVSILSSFPNPFNLRWIDVLFNPLRF